MNNDRDITALLNTNSSELHEDLDAPKLTYLDVPKKKKKVKKQKK